MKEPTRSPIKVFKLPSPQKIFRPFKFKPFRPPRQPKLYRHQVAALFLGIKAKKAPKVDLTGLAIRPIVPGTKAWEFLKKRKKRKKKKRR